MLPDHLRYVARRAAKDRRAIRLAIFGPGIGAPYFEKRREMYRAIQAEHAGVEIMFHMIDESVPPSEDYDDYVRRVRPAELKQIEWADVILFLFTHHKLTALVEYILVHDLRSRGQQDVFNKCALAIKNDLEVSSLWHYEAQNSLRGKTTRIVEFDSQDLTTCRVAKDLSIELFQRVVIERWGII